MSGSTHSVSTGIVFASLWNHVSKGLICFARHARECRALSLWSRAAAHLVFTLRNISIEGISASQNRAVWSVVLYTGSMPLRAVVSTVSIFRMCVETLLEIHLLFLSRFFAGHYTSAA